MRERNSPAISRGASGIDHGYKETVELEGDFLRETGDIEKFTLLVLNINIPLASIGILRHIPSIGTQTGNQNPRTTMRMWPITQPC